jgi:pimeloyl-ACP methyl ester carboxylesterase
MPFLDTPNTTMYYDISEPNFTTLSHASHVRTVLLIHGFGGTPESDFGAQMPALLGHFRVIAPHLHGYGRSTHRSRYALSFYRDDAADLIQLLDSLNIDKVMVLGFIPLPIS